MLLLQQLNMHTIMKYILQSDKDSFLKIALDSYRCCLATGDKYDLRVVDAFASAVKYLYGSQRI